MRKMKIVLGVIRQGDMYLFQFRDGDPKIGGAGKTGSFGGKIEEGEDALNAVVREIGEETTLITTPQMWQHLGEVRVISDHKLEDVQVHATVFLCELDNQIVEAKEGKLVVLSHKDIPLHLDTFTTGTRAAFEKLIFKEQKQ